MSPSQNFLCIQNIGECRIFAEFPSIEDKLPSFWVVLFYGNVVYEAIVNENDLKRYYIPSKLAEYYETTKKVFQSNYETLQETVQLVISQGPIDTVPTYFEISWKKTPKNGTFAQPLGQIFLPLSLDQTKTAVSVLSLVLDDYKIQKETADRLKYENENNSKQSTESCEELIKFAQDAREREDELVGKFVALLNEKKSKISELMNFNR